MKSKPNSKQQPQPPKKTSLLISHSNPKPTLLAVPTHFPQSILCLDLSSNRIGSTKGIEIYGKLEKLDLSYNAIADYSDLKALSLCSNLKELTLEGNPICGRVNYLFGVFAAIHKVIVVDGLDMDCGLNVISQWQKYNGFKVALFLFQSCLIFDSILRGKANFDLQGVMEELHQVQGQMKALRGESFRSINSRIYSCFPLNSIETPEKIEHQMVNIKDYYIQKLLEVAPGGSNRLVEKLLGQIQVADEDEERQLQTKVEVTELILKNKMEDQFKISQQAIHWLKAKGEDQKISHFVSAQTALETIDTAGRIQTDVLKYGIHFSMDIQFLEEALTVIKKQIQRVLHVVEEEEKKCGHDSLQTFRDLIEDSVSEKKVSSPAQVYGNSTILCNLLSILELPLKKVAFRKIKTYRPRKEIERVHKIFRTCLSRTLTSIYHEVFCSLKMVRQDQIEIEKQIDNYRIKKLLLAWANIKKKKMKLLRNIIKRKIKCNTFLAAVALTRWKMNSRADRIRRMASAILLNTRISSMPKSKKGIDLAYKRTLASRPKLL